MFSRKVETLVWRVCMRRCRDFRNSEVYSWVLARKPSSQPWILSFHIDDKCLRSGGKFYVNFIYANLSKVRCDWTLTAFCAYIYVGCLIRRVRMKNRFYWQIDHGTLEMCERVEYRDNSKAMLVWRRWRQQKNFKEVKWEQITVKNLIEEN